MKKSVLILILIAFSVINYSVETTEGIYAKILILEGLL